jgi:hypothetical protein
VFEIGTEWCHSDAIGLCFRDRHDGLIGVNDELAAF